MFTITITWATVKWAGLLLFLLSIFSFFAGSLPDNDARPVGDALRWISWPLFIIWLIVMIIKGIAS